MLLPWLPLPDDLKKVLTAHKHLSGMGVEYFSPTARSPVNFVRVQLEEVKIEGVQSAQCDRSDDIWHRDDQIIDVNIAARLVSGVPHSR